MLFFPHLEPMNMGLQPINVNHDKEYPDQGLCKLDYYFQRVIHFPYSYIFLVKL